MTKKTKPTKSATTLYTTITQTAPAIAPNNSRKKSQCPAVDSRRSKACS